MTEEEFRTQLADNGYTDGVTNVYEPGTDGEFHTHEFSAMLMVTEGEFTLVLEDGPRTFVPGEWCELPAGTVHYEQSGSDGATVLAGAK